ncbi:D-2-hydroxyacid dehydrogenase [Paenibacillus sp. FA6]|uniref:D-2-hydroxyacid dehydrogenase n=1 Tax=Paenibacillus sp. FA6 TaxID=3413029 RepID=UPI003F657D44
MKRIISLYPLSADHLQQIYHIAPNYTVTIGKANLLDPEVLLEAEVLLGWSNKFEQNVLHEDSSLKWIQSWSAGVDKMPLDLFSEQDILLTTASGVHSIPIAESIFAMMLAFSRGIQQSIQNQQANLWNPKIASGGSGTLSELHDKTIVIVGVGEIGSKTAQIAKAFGMNVLGVRRSGKSSPYVDTMFTMVNLHEALNQSDYIINILPLTEETRHIFDTAAFTACKRGTCFINVGRGPTVDTTALLGALEEGTIGYAGLDVFEEEPLPADHPLWKMNQVIITPHISGNTEHYDERVFDIFIENLKAYIEGQGLPRNLVNYTLKY